MSSSRDRLDMMEDGGNKRHSSLTYTEKNGYYVRPKVAFCLLILFITTIIAVALLVHYLAPCPAESHDASADLVGGGSGIGIVETGDTTTSAPAKPLVDVRLPLDMRPLHYTLTLQPYLVVGNFTFDGEVIIEIECLKTTSTITLHIHNMTIHETETQVSAASNKQIGVEKHRYDKVRQFLQIDLREKLRPGDKYSARLKFTGELNNNMAGFYRSYENTTGWLATTQFQPTDARRAFPCFDEPGLKAKFTVTLVRPSKMTSLSNMPIKESVPRPGGEWVEDRYYPTVNMSTYLVAFVVSNFENRTVIAGNNKTKFGVWARPSAIDQTQYALNIGPRILHNYETFFRTEYPLPKQDMIAIPDFSAGAMENWGLITYRETAMLYDSKVSSASDKQRVAFVIAHELAHQWFGNLVTLEWWDDLWLNEGFASYVEYIGIDSVEPSWRMHEQFVVMDLQEVFELDSLETSHPISVPVGNPDEINEIFDQISYAKGASIIRMMFHFLGEDTFKKGLTNYLNDKKYKNAVQDDLWHHLTIAAKDDGKNVNVKHVMDTWTLQTGYPVVSVERDYTGQAVVLSQQRFLLKNSTNKTQLQAKWEIPITLATSNSGFDKTLPVTWMKPNQDKLKLTSAHGIPTADEWVIFNAQQTGYYRVNYDIKNWKSIIGQLKANHLQIPPINRAQILDDALDLARANYLSYDLAMSVTEYLVNEKDYIPWKAALHSLDYIDRMLSRSAAYGMWKKYLTQQLKPIYEHLGFKDNPASDPHITQLTRASIVRWSCYTEVQDCVTQATALYRNWMNGNLTEPISPNQKQAIACMGIKYGGEKEWNFAWNKYLESNVGAEKDTLLSAMACSYEPWILSKYLEMTINEKSRIRKQDVRFIISQVANNKIGRYLALNFVRDKWMKFKNGFAGAFFMSSIVKGVMRGLNTPFELQELKSFAELHKDNLGSATRAIHQMIEETESNIYWMEKNYEPIFEWLRTVVPA